MRETGLQIICLLLGLMPGFMLNGQDPQALISLHMEQEPMRKVLIEIEGQCGYSFSYNSRLLDEEELVTIHVEKDSLAHVLQILFAGRKLSFRLLEQQIVLKRSRRLKVEEVTGMQTESPHPLAVQFTISGFVKDSRTGEVLIGATITIPGGAEGTITNNYGFYSLTLREAVDHLICSYVGYGQRIFPLSHTRDQIMHFAMEKEVRRLSEVRIYSNDETSIVRTSRSSEERINPESVRKMPALFGEKDVIKSLAAIPGVKFFGDGSTIFYVRGGARDQNMITIDEAPVYNPTHLLGFFSTIVPDAIKEVKIYKGDFPAVYGGRLSSLVDIRTKDGNMKHFGMDGSLGLLSSRLSLEGPIWTDHISFFVSGRRSYITKALQRVNERINDLHFSDLHLKLNYNINKNNRIFLSTYHGVDNFEQLVNQESSSGINWKNSTTSFRWNHLFSNRLFSNLTLLGSRYDYSLNTHLEQKDYWNSHIDNLSLKHDFTFYARPSYTLRFGLLAAGHFYNPGNYYRGDVEFDPGLDLSVKHTREYALYISNQFILNETLSLRAGFRLTAWNNIGPSTEYNVIPSSGGDFGRDSLAITEHPEGKVYHTYLSPDPRLSLVYQPRVRHLFKLSYSRTSQFQYLITNSISPFTSLEVWLPAGPHVRPQVAHQLTLGYTHRLGVPGLRFDLEAYYKRMNHLIDYRDHARMLMNPLVEYELRFGYGTAYGLESIVHKDFGKLKGWVSYTLSRALSRVSEINEGNLYPSYSDRPHDFSLYLSWTVNARLTLTGNFIYMTGVPFTTPTGYYYYDNHQVPVYAERNNDRLPDYHRLDVALNWQLSRPERKFQHELIFSVYNLYNRKNPVALHFNKIVDEKGNYVVPSDYFNDPELLTTQFYLYGIVPSVSYHFNF